VNTDTLQPVRDLVLVKTLNRDELATMTEGGLHLPQQAEDRQRYRQWEVVACGPYVQDEAILPGARVLLQQFSGTPIEIAPGVFCAFVCEEYVSAIIQE